MLSIYTLKSAKDASIYYQQGDYYTAEGTEGYSFWWGKGSQTLELKGAVDFKVFKALLEGRLPNQETMIQTEKGQHHRPGYDLTFSAPKSVSILALVLGNKEVLQAHRKAVKGVLTHLETHEAAYRRKVKGRIHIEKTDNYTVATFEHSDSRAGDPNLHTHTVLMNMTQRADGAWRALYADNLYTDKLFHGMEYRSLLARELLHLGFELEFKEKGLFEIIGIPEPLMQHWSKRREEIEQWLKENDLSGGEAAVQANFKTRAPKGKHDREDRIEGWLHELKSCGFNLKDLQVVVERAKARGPIALPEPDVIAEHAVNAAIHYLRERQPLFTIETVIKAAKRLSVLRCSEGDFLKVIENKIEAKSLIFVEGKKLTTPETLSLQHSMMDALKENKDSIDKILTPWIADIALGFTVKHQAEREVLKALLTDTHHQILVSADSRASLLSLLKHFKSLTEHQDYYPRFLTQSQMSAATLREQLGTDRVSTLAGFLLSCEKRAEEQKSFLPGWLQAWDKRVKAREARDIWVVQGAISPQELSQLQRWSKQFNARIIFTQTKHQNLPLFSFLKEKGLPEIQFDTKNKAELSPRMALLEKLETLEKSQAFHSIANYKARLQKAADVYELGSQLIVSNHTERIFLNNAVRSRLKETGALPEESKHLTILQPLALTKIEKSQIHLYQLNDVIRFNQALPELRVEKGDYLKVQDVNLMEAKITLQSPAGKIVKWSLTQSPSVDVFREDVREVMIGEKLVWTRTLKHENNKSLDRIKNQSALVTAITGNQITVTLKNGKRVSFNATDYKEQHWDHGYAIVLKNTGSQAANHTIALLSHHHLDNKTVSEWQELFNQKNIRHYTILCEDVEKLKQVRSMDPKRISSR